MAKRILVVEDNEMNLKLFCDLLAAFGHGVLVATTGNEALHLAQKEHPDLILLDIQLPDISGLEVVRILKENQSMKDIPIIAVTAFAMSGDSEKALAVGCDAYITKPISIPGFREEIEKMLKA